MKKKHSGQKPEIVNLPFYQQNAHERFHNNDLPDRVLYLSKKLFPHADFVTRIPEIPPGNLLSGELVIAGKHHDDFLEGKLYLLYTVGSSTARLAKAILKNSRILLNIYEQNQKSELSPEKVKYSYLINAILSEKTITAI